MAKRVDGEERRGKRWTGWDCGRGLYVAILVQSCRLGNAYYTSNGPGDYGVPRGHCGHWADGLGRQHGKDGRGTPVNPMPPGLRDRDTLALEAGILESTGSRWRRWGSPDSPSRGGWTPPEGTIVHQRAPGSLLDSPGACLVTLGAILPCHITMPCLGPVLALGGLDFQIRLAGPSSIDAGLGGENM